MRRSPHLGPLLLLTVVAAALGLGIYSGVRARSVADGTLKNATAEAAIAVVNVVSKPGGGKMGGRSWEWPRF